MFRLLQRGSCRSTTPASAHGHMSMGGMHSWINGQLHLDFMDALMPLASLPTQISDAIARGAA